MTRSPAPAQPQRTLRVSAAALLGLAMAIWVAAPTAAQAQQRAQSPAAARGQQAAVYPEDVMAIGEYVLILRTFSPKLPDALFRFMRDYADKCGRPARATEVRRRFGAEVPDTTVGLYMREALHQLHTGAPASSIACS